MLMIGSSIEYMYDVCTLYIYVYRESLITLWKLSRHILIYSSSYKHKNPFTERILVLRMSGYFKPSNEDDWFPHRFLSLA